MFLIGAVPGLIVAYLISKLPESPRWLINRGRLDEAERIIEAMETRNAYAIQAEANELPIITITIALSTAAHASRGCCRVRKRPVGSSCCHQPFLAARSPSGHSGRAPISLRTASTTGWQRCTETVYGLDLRTGVLAASMTNVAQVILLLVCVFTIDRIGRRNWVAGIVRARRLGFGHPRDNGRRERRRAHGARHACLRHHRIDECRAVSLHARDLSDAHACDWHWSCDVLAEVGLGAPRLRSSDSWSGEQGIAAVFLMFAGVSRDRHDRGHRGMIETRNRRLEDIAQ